MALPQPSIAQLRPALQLALEVAMAPGPTRPGRVRSLVRARRLPANWPVTMAQALGEDDAFRAEVAAAATEEAVGPLAWLWLTRPDGWVASLEAALEREAAAASAEEERLRLESRLAEAEGELARARARAEEARAREDGLASQIQEAFAVAQRAGEQLADAEVRISSLTAELGRRDERLGRYEDEIAALRAEPARLGSELQDARAQLAQAESERARAEASARSAGDAALAADERSRAVSSELVRVRRVAAEALQGAARGARQVDAAVSGALSELGTGERQPGGRAPAGAASPERPAGAGPGVPPAPPAAGPPAADPPAGGRPAARGPGAGGPAAGGSAAAPPEAGERGAGEGPGRRAGRPARRPLRLPPAVFEDSPEAAEYLIRRAGVHLIVDGYNVAFRSWSAGDLPTLRNRLIDALSELAVRVKREVTVVFDGAAEGGRVSVAPVVRPWLRVVFSASTEEADEVIVAAVGALPAGTAVAVATDDRRVRSDVRQLGANVITVQQLLAVLRRSGGPDPAW